MPTSFTNGPAAGQRLLLRRAPHFLRVAEKDGRWDALDQVTDEPQKGETLHAYYRVSDAGVCHINMGRGKGGFYAIAEYAVCEDQPSQETMAGRCAWQEWCWAEQGKTKEAPPIAGEAPRDTNRTDLFP